MDWRTTQRGKSGVTSRHHQARSARLYSLCLDRQYFKKYFKKDENISRISWSVPTMAEEAAEEEDDARGDHEDEAELPEEITAQQTPLE